MQTFFRGYLNFGEKVNENLFKENVNQVEYIYLLFFDALLFNIF